MFKCCTPSEDEQHRKERYQRHRDIQEYRGQLKCLLVGTPGSGKSTFLKQLKILCGGGYSPEERKSFTSEVHSNLVRGIQTLICSMETLNLEYGNPEICSTLAALFANSDDVILHAQRVNAVQTLWADRGIQEAWARRNEIPNLQDTVSYFFQHIERIGSVGYMPSDEDILRVYTPSDGCIAEHRFEMETETCTFIEISYQLRDQKNWLNFDGFDVPILFFVPLNGFNATIDGGDDGATGVQAFQTENVEPLFESAINFSWFNDYGDKCSRMIDQSKDLFRRITSNWSRRHRGMMLFFSKRNLLDEDMTEHYAEFLTTNSSGFQIMGHGMGSIEQCVYSMLNQGGKRSNVSEFVTACLINTQEVRASLCYVKGYILDAYWL